MKQLFIVLLLATNHFGFGQSEHVAHSQKLINVTGSAEMEIVPDIIVVAVKLKEYQYKNQPKVTLETLQSAFLQQCKQAGFADSNIAVATLSGNTAWYQQKSKRNPEMMAEINYEIRCQQFEQIEKLANILDEQAIASFYISYTSHTKMAEYRKQVKTMAVKAAKEKATYMAEAIGEKAGAALRIKELEEKENNFFQGGYLRQSNTMLRASADDNENTALGMRKLKIRYEVEADFALL